MINNLSNDADWLHWIEIQAAATKAWSGGDLAEAIAQLDEYLASQPSKGLRRQAIGFRGSLHQEHGNLPRARSDYFAARELSEKADFERCTLEESIAVLAEQLGDHNDADRWYREALKTASLDPRAGTGSLVLRFIEKRRPSGLNIEEGELCAKILRTTWRLMQQEGELDISDLVVAARRVVAAQSRADFSLPPADDD